MLIWSQVGDPTSLSPISVGNWRSARKELCCETCWLFYRLFRFLAHVSFMLYAWSFLLELWIATVTLDLSFPPLSFPASSSITASSPPHFIVVTFTWHLSISQSARSLENQPGNFTQILLQGYWNRQMPTFSTKSEDNKKSNQQHQIYCSLVRIFFVNTGKWKEICNWIVLILFDYII